MLSKDFKKREKEDEVELIHLINEFHSCLTLQVSARAPGTRTPADTCGSGNASFGRQSSSRAMSSFARKWSEQEALG